MQQTNEYVFARIKNVFINDDGIEVLFLFAGLTLNTLVFQDNEQAKTVKPIVSKVIEIPVEDAPESYLEMENHDYRIEIEKEEFERLEELAREDIEAFFVYAPNGVS